MAKALRRISLVLMVAIGLVFAGVGVLQSRPGKDFLASRIAHAISNSRFTWAIDGLGGAVPLAMTAESISVTDDEGTWLVLRDVALDIDPASLFSRKLRLRLLHAGAWDQARPPSGHPPPLPVILRLLRLPFDMIVDRLVIDRVNLARPVLGAPVVATITGMAAFRGPVRGADLDIHRVDGSPGNIGLQLTIDGDAPRLGVKLRASDPTGLIDDRVLGRTDHLPFALSLDGDGPVSDWRGRLAARAGPHAQLDAEAAVMTTATTTLDLSAHSAIASLLPAALAPVVGDEATLSLRVRFGEPITVERGSVRVAAGTLRGDGAVGGAGATVTAHLRADLPDLAKFSAIAGRPLAGAAAVTADISGSRQRPAVTADLTASALAVAGAAIRATTAHVSASLTGAIGDPHTSIALDARGRLVGLDLPEGGAVARRLGGAVAWSVKGAIDPNADAAEFTAFHLSSGGVELAGSGRLVDRAHGLTGGVDLTGSAQGWHTGVAAADLLLGPAPTLAASLRREAAGVVAIDHLALTGAAARLAGNVRFDPASDTLVAALTLEVPRLAALRAALGAGIGGSLSGKVTVEGLPDRLRLAANLDGSRLTAGGVSLDRLQLGARVADLTQPTALIDGSFRAGRLDGRVGLAATPIGTTGVALDNIRIAAAGGVIAGNLRIPGPVAQGSLQGHLPDLSRWSALAGRQLAGALDLRAVFAAAGGRQSADVAVDGTHLVIGGAAVGRLKAEARLADLWRQPTGSGRLQLADLRAGGFDLANAALSFEARGPGRFAFDGNAAGKPLHVVFAGDGGLVPGGGELRLSRLSGSLDHDNFALEQPLGLSRRGSELAIEHLALRVGPGRLAGDGRLRGETLSFSLTGADLPLAAAGRLIGRPDLHGRLTLAATVGGNLPAPQGHFKVEAAGLALARAHEAVTPRLGLTVAGDWNGRALSLDGRVTGLHGDNMTLTGLLPLVLTPAPLALSLPGQGRLALKLEGGGEIGHLADFLPIGEDRLSGKFAADASIGGTVAVPNASGRLRLEGGRYENFFSGAVLSDLDAELDGNGESLRLARLKAGDGAGGTVSAEGGLTLGAAGAAQLSAKLYKFRIAARDELVASASGTLTVAGPLSALRLTAPLTIEQAQVNLPNNLPPDVVVLKVTEKNARPQPLGPPPAISAPALPAILDISLGVPGPVFVQGRGLDSQWSGRLNITGTAAAPKIAGTLTANRGGYTLFGKSFRLTRGTLTFDGSARIDPALDIAAEASAADITAQVTVSGYASSPKVELSSTPALPRDEILARLLFGSGVRQITAGQGLQLAQAAAALSGAGGTGLLDRLRGGLGLDWLRFGQGPAATASSILNPTVTTPTTTSTAAVSVGKYIAPGVSVGVTQGVSPPTSKVTVEVDLGHHVTVDTETGGQNVGTGIGLNYSFDY
jgi:translocation and assembly module TamB